MAHCSLLSARSSLLAALLAALCSLLSARCSVCSGRSHVAGKIVLEVLHVGFTSRANWSKEFPNMGQTCKAHGPCMLNVPTLQSAKKSMPRSFDPSDVAHACNWFCINRPPVTNCFVSICPNVFSPVRDECAKPLLNLRSLIGSKLLL